MGELTEISWTDSTFNPWIGCMKVSPACDHCYAEAYARRWGQDWGAPGIGVGTRRRTVPSNWSKPRKWNRLAAEAQAAGGPAHFVFCASLADVFDNAVDPAWRADLFQLVRETAALTWLFLTKRPQNIVAMSTAAGGLPPNVALGSSMVLPGEVARDAPILVKAKELLSPRFIFVSAEPLLGDIAEALRPWMPFSGRLGIDWLIVGGESGPGARPMHPDWARNCRDLALESGAAFHFKQWGEHRPFRIRPHLEWEFEKVGKVAAGRLLDGELHDARPAAVAVGTAS